MRAAEGPGDNIEKLSSALHINAIVGNRWVGPFQVFRYLYTKTRGRPSEKWTNVIKLQYIECKVCVKA